MWKYIGGTVEREHAWRDNDLESLQECSDSEANDIVRTLASIATASREVVVHPEECSSSDAAVIDMSNVQVGQGTRSEARQILLSRSLQ